MSTSPKKVTKKRSAKPTGPSTLDLVKKAITALKEPKGSSGAAIKKQIAAGSVVKRNALVNRALIKGVQTGDLKQVKGSGANGSFRLDVAKQQKAEKGKLQKAKAAARKKEQADKAKASKAKKAAAAKANLKKATKKTAVKKPAAKKAAKPKKAAKKPVKKAAKKPVKKAAKKKVAKKPAAKK